MYRLPIVQTLLNFRDLHLLSFFTHHTRLINNIGTCSIITVCNSSGRAAHDAGAGRRAQRQRRLPRTWRPRTPHQQVRAHTVYTCICLYFHYSIVARMYLQIRSIKNSFLPTVFYTKLILPMDISFFLFLNL